MKRWFLLLLMAGGLLVASAQSSLAPKTHVVVAGETYYGICRQYGVSIADLMKANKLDENSVLQIGQKLVIPVQGKGEKSAKQEKKKTHVVQAGETLYGLSRQYGVTVGELLAANKLDESSILSIGQKLIIPAATPQNALPAQEAVAVVETPVEQEPVKEENTEFEDTTLVQEETATQNQILKRETPVRVAYLLPLLLDKTTTGTNNIATIQQKRPDGTTYRQVVVDVERLERFVEFYQGSLLSINELAAKGARIEVQVYDIGKTTESIQTVLDSTPAIKTVDIIFGLTYPEQVQPLSEYSFNEKIYTILPVSSNVPDLQVNPYLVQFNATDEDLMTAKINFLKKRAARGDNLVFMHVDGEKTDDVERMQKELTAAGVKFQDQSIMTAPTEAALQLKLEKEKENCLIFNTPKSAKADVWMSLMTESFSDYDIILLADYQWLLRKENIKLPFYYPSLFRTDNDDMETYTKQYEEYFAIQNLSSTTPRYDALGYDLTRLCLTVMNNSGSHFGADLPKTNFVGVSTTPVFKRVSDKGGLRNQGTKLYRTDQYGTFLSE